MFDRVIEIIWCIGKNIHVEIINFTCLKKKVFRTEKDNCENKNWKNKHYMYVKE